MKNKTPSGFDDWSDERQMAWHERIKKAKRENARKNPPSKEASAARRAKDKAYRKAHKARYQKHWNAYRQRRRMKDPAYRLRQNLSGLIRASMRQDSTSKRGKFCDYIGCSPAQLRQHIESMFCPGMSWNNYGSVWSVDHIIPRSAFDHSVEAQARLCHHYTNLRPMWSAENCRKANLITEPQMSLPLPK